MSETDRATPSRKSSAWSAEIESVYREQGRELWALFYAHCSDADRAYDALQESLLRLQEQNGTPIRDVRAWILQVGRNWLRDVARRQRVAAKPTENLDRLKGSHEEPSFVLEKQELQSQVREALGQLKIEDREVLVFRYALSWSSKQIAIALESTASAIDMRLSRARQRLADILEKSGVDHERA